MTAARFPGLRAVSKGWRATAGLLAICAGIVVGPNSSSHAQSFPTRTVKIIVPLPPGPVADVVPRLIGEKLSQRWSQPVIIENRPGAALNIGADAASRAEPDGHTLLATPPAPLVVSQHYYPKLPFDPSKFVPVTVLVRVPAVLVAHPKVPADDLPQLIAHAKANPDKLSYGSPGAGNTPHLATVKLMAAAGIRMVHVPYQGLAPALRDLLAGHIDVMVDNVGNVAEHIKAGRLKLLAATTDARIADFPNVATVAETLPGITHTDWFAVAAPPGTPGAIATKISADIAAALKEPDVQRRLKELSLVAVGSSPEETSELLKRESEMWRKVIAASGLKAE
jgi:tripartite-type tricarboxylate transporter receptor subunit TctC